MLPTFRFFQKETKEQAMKRGSRRQSRVSIACFMGALACLAGVCIPFLTPQAQAQSYVRLLNAWKGTYLYESGDQLKYGTPANTDQTSHWVVEDSGNGQVRLKNRASGEYANIQNNLAHVEVTPVDATWTSSKWQLVEQSGYKRIVSASQPTKAINVQSQLGYAQYTALSTTYKSTWWTLESVGNPTATPTPAPTLAPTPTPGTSRGASIPWTNYEAENGITNGTLLSTSRVVGTAAAECSGRSGVTLSTTGQSVQWTTVAPANALVVRLSIPDAPTGGGIDSMLNLYVNGTLRQAIPVTSRHSWLYGNEDAPVNTPGGTARRIFDESSALIGNVPAGATISLRKDAVNTAAYYTIDFIELEQAPTALAMPANFLSITGYGATPNDDTDDAQAIQNTYNAAKTQGKGVWIPSGTFRQSQRITVDNIAIKGAGVWYSKLLSHHNTAPTNSNDTAGFWVMNNTQFSNFAIFGTMTERGAYKNVSPFRGPFGTGSVIENIWSEHVECFVWAGVDSSAVFADGLIVRNNRIRNTYADGINFASGTKNSVMENNHARNTGDDAFAIYSSPRTIDTAPDLNNTIRNCTAQMPWRASGIAIYGGYGNSVDNCTVYDTLTYPGMMVQRGANSRPFGPAATTLQNVDLFRCGGTFWNGQQYGALWALTGTGTIDNGNILIKNVNVYDASYSGIHVQSNNNLSQTGITFDNIRIQGAGTYGIFVRSGAVGSGTFSNISVAGAVAGGLKQDAPTTYSMNLGAGNTGW